MAPDFFLSAGFMVRECGRPLPIAAFIPDFMDFFMAVAPVISRGRYQWNGVLERWGLSQVDGRASKAAQQPDHRDDDEQHVSHRLEGRLDRENLNQVEQEPDYDDEDEQA